MIKVGITGQSGFIGTHLYNYLGLKENIKRIVFKDEFFDHYCGKSYGGFLDYGNTEIISMGLEQMVRKPYTFFKQDPDYFNFILKVMWGDLK